MMIGRWLANVRKQQGFTQDGLASRLGVARSTLSRWEVGIDPIAPTSHSAIAAVLGVSVQDLERPTARGLVPHLGAPLVYAPAYPVKKLIEDVKKLGQVAQALVADANLGPAVALEVENRLPRDTEYELLAAYHFFSLSAELEFWSCDELRCPLLVTGHREWGNQSSLRRHTLVLRRDSTTVFLQPQVTVALVVQSRRYRLDYLVTRVRPTGIDFADLELDGPIHDDDTEGDTRRAYGLGIPTLRYPNAALLRRDFAARVLADILALP